MQQYVATNREDFAPDVVVVLDTGDVRLLGEAQGLLTHYRAQGTTIICIDHHPSNHLFGDINIVETSAAAACELLYDLFQDSRIEISLGMAHSLLGGILGDTHKLTTGHVTAATLRKVADLMELGADRVKIMEGMPVIASIPTAKVWGQILGSIQLAGENNEIAYAVATQEILAALDEAYVKNISSFIRDIGGVAVAVLFLEKAEGLIKIEFRSKSEVNVGKVAEALGGGGHRGASGCSLYDMSLDAAINLTLDTLIRHIGN